MPGKSACLLRSLVAIGLMALHATAMPIDIAPLWDFRNPAGSEARFREALKTANGDDGLILQTQIARTHGLRKDFVQARAVLQAIAHQMPAAGPEARVRHALEWGRAHASATHLPEALTPEAQQEARKAYEQALAMAGAAGLDELAIDATHMLAFVDTAPADQLKWAQAALAIVQASSQPKARAWEASIRHNIGYALHQLGRYDLALLQFQQALVLREKAGAASRIRVARWMVAWTLRSLGRSDEALAMQLQLERDGDAAGEPDRYVYEELETLYRALGQTDRAEHYGRLKQAQPG